MAVSVPPAIVLKTGLAAPARIGVIASLALFGIVFAWMQTTMIASAVIAPGQAVVRGKPKVVQSLDGGVIERIFVTDGDVVRAGDILLRLDPTLLVINLNIYRNRLAEIVARQARLEAEYLAGDTIAFPTPPDLLAGIELGTHFTGQREIFEARREVQDGRREQLDERIAQFSNQITGIEGRIEATRDQVTYVKRELESMRKLREEGLARESQVLELQRAESALLGTLSEALAELAKTRNSIRDTEMEILQTQRQFKEEVVTELREVTAAHEELVLQIVTVQKQLDRIDIVAPVTGVIHEMQVFTVGGVVPPESTILEVIPVSDGVEFEVRIDPKSIDQVFVGQQARLVFPAFDSRTTPEIFGSLRSISPTSILDPATQQTYYRITLTVPPDQLDLLGDVELIPGMPIEAFLQTGDRSVLTYLTKPLTDQLQRAFRDN